MFQLSTVLVTGATGRQGSAVSRALLERGHRVLALVRSAMAHEARALEQRGAQLVEGDFDEPVLLEEAMREADAVFAMATPFGPGGLEAEVRHGRHLIEAAKLSRVPYFLYSSVAGAQQGTGIPHFETKRVLEEELRHSGLMHTVVAPVFFMDNFLGPAYAQRLHEGALALALPPHKGLQMTSTRDLASLCVRLLEEPERMEGQRLEVASDEVTGEQAAALLSYVSGHRLRYEQVPLMAVRSRSAELELLFGWLQREGFRAEISHLRQDFPEVGWHSFLDWARLQDWSALLGTPWRGALAAEPSFT